MINTFKIGDRVSHNGFNGTVVSNRIELRTLKGVKAFANLVEFDATNGKDYLFENHELNFKSCVGAINQNFLTKII